MTETNFEKVINFTKAFNLPSANPPSLPTGDLHKLRINLIFEELTEFIEAAAQGNIAKATKELADTLYVLYGYAVTMGIDIDYAFQLVHESNLSKLDSIGKPQLRSDGKVLKGINYKPVDESALILPFRKPSL